MNIEDKVFLDEGSELSESEKSVVSGVLEQINQDSIVSYSIKDIEPISSGFEADSYKINSIGGDKLVLKISFGDAQSLFREYDTLRTLADLNMTPSALNKYEVRCFASEGLAILESFVDGFTVMDFGIYDVFSCDEELERLFGELALISEYDGGSIENPLTEDYIGQNVGNLIPVFGLEEAERLGKILNMKGFSSDLRRLRVDLSLKASQYNLGKIVNGDLRPDTIIFPSGKERKHKNYYLSSWGKTFLGNPLFDLMNFILENRLFSISEKCKLLFFKKFNSINPRLSREMEKMYQEYFNYFIATRFWMDVVHYLKLCASNEFSSLSTIEHVRFIETLDFYKATVYKVIPSCEKFLDRFFLSVSEQQNNQ